MTILGVVFAVAALGLLYSIRVALASLARQLVVLARGLSEIRDRLPPP